MTIYADVIVFEILFVAWLTFSTRGRELVYSLGMKWLKWYTGFSRFTTVQMDGIYIQSVRFRDGSRFCIERDADGIIREYHTGGLSAVYDRCRLNLAASFLR